MPAAMRAAGTRTTDATCACSRGGGLYEQPEAPAAASGAARLPRRIAPAGLAAAPPRKARAWHNPIEAPMSGRKRWTHLDQMVGEGTVGAETIGNSDILPKREGCDPALAPSQVELAGLAHALSKGADA